MHTVRIKAAHGDQATALRFIEVFNQMHETLQGASISLELYSDAQNITYVLSGSLVAVKIACAHIYGMSPEAIIEDIPDPLNDQYAYSSGFEFYLTRSDLFPLKDFSSVEGEILTNFLSALTNIPDGSRICSQLVISPAKDTWFFHLGLRLKKIKLTIVRKLWIKYWLKKGIVKTFEEKIERKTTSRLFRSSIRVIIQSKTPIVKTSLETISRAVATFNTLDYNSLRTRSIKSVSSHLQLKKRIIKDPFLLSVEELATWYHIPSEQDVPNIVRVLSKLEAPPKNLPTAENLKNITPFGITNFRDKKVPFGILEEDRARHLFVVGKSGSGKSKLLELLIQSDIENGRGVGVLDPHGDLVDNILRTLPKDRIKDVVIFDPSDLEFPPSFNPLEQVPELLKMRVTIGFIEIFKKLFGTNWSPRLEHVLRYTTLALLDSPDTTVLSILEMLSNKDYRQEIVKNITDRVVKNFWVNEFAGWSEKFDAEAITPLINKIGQFVSTNMIRNIVGQKENKFQFRSFMDSKKIVLMKISKGTLGEENASLLGAMLVTKIFQAAMSRADILEHQRTPFFLYVDEFHNFATSTFGEILSEARKYGLCLTLANQFLGQLDTAMRKTVFGNVGSLISFRLGGEDANHMVQEFSPRFEATDLMNLGVREFCMKMSIKGQVSEAFSGITLDRTYPKIDFSKAAIEYSRVLYANSRSSLEASTQSSMKSSKKIIFEQPLL